jgi:integrase/recombinase XerD
MLKMTHVAVPRKLPVILSPEEVGRLIAAAPNLKHQAAMSVAYGAGLRVSEVVSLKVGDIDGERMTLRVEQGKGRKDRYAMLSPCCWSGCAPGGGLATPRARSATVVGCSRAWTPPTT